MQHITEINRDTVKQIAAEAEKTLTELAERLGIGFRMNGGKFDPVGGEFSPKITFTVEGSEEMTFGKECDLVWTTIDGKMVSLEPGDYGTLFSYGADLYKLVGVNLRAPKYPLIGENRAGKRFKFTKDAIPKIVAARIAPKEAA